MVQAVEIEIDGQHNEKLFFAPLERPIRGRFDMSRIAEPMAKIEASKWPVPIPSQRVGIDPDGNGYLIEPLHDPEHAPIKEKIAKKGKRLEPAIQNFDNVHLPTWLFWMKRAVDSGLARITKGKLPETIEGTPKLDFINAPREPSTTDRIQKTLEAQTAAFDRLATAIEKLASK